MPGVRSISVGASAEVEANKVQRYDGPLAVHPTVQERRCAQANEAADEEQLDVLELQSWHLRGHVKHGLSKPPHP